MASKRTTEREAASLIVSFDAPDGNRVEILPNVETMDLPPGHFAERNGWTT